MPPSSQSPEYAQALAVLQSGVAPTKGERQSRADLLPHQYEARREHGRLRAERLYNRKGAPKYNDQLAYNRKYWNSAGRYVKRDWEPWEDDFIRDHQGVPSRLIALGLQRSIRAVQLRRLSPRYLQRIYDTRESKIPAEVRAKQKTRAGLAGLFPVKRWSDEEVEYVRTHKNDLPLDVAKALGRSMDSVKRCKHRLFGRHRALIPAKRGQRPKAKGSRVPALRRRSRKNL